MGLNRIITGVVTGAMLGLTPLALAAPADAAVTVGTATSLSSEKVRFTYGDQIFFDAAVTTNDPSNPYAPGSATLYMMPKGSSSWTPVSTDDGVSYLWFDDVHARQNATYKVVYPGGTDYSGNTYTRSESAPFTVKVMRKVVAKNPRGTLVKGKVTPDYKRKKVIFQRKSGKWRTYKAIKTSRRGTFAITLPAPRTGRWHWRLVVPGNTKFIKNVMVLGYTYQARTSARAAVGR